MNLEDIQKYFNKSGDNEILTDNLIENEHGFMSWTINDEGDFLILQVYGNGSYWDEVSQVLAEAMEAKKIIFATKRNYKGFVRKFGYKLTGYILEKDVQ